MFSDVPVEVSVVVILNSLITPRQRSVNQRLTNGVYKNPFLFLKGHKNVSIPRVVGLCFCLVSVLLVYFDCVTCITRVNKHFYFE